MERTVYIKSEDKEIEINELIEEDEDHYIICYDVDGYLIKKSLNKSDLVIRPYK